MLGGKIQTVKLEENTNETETADFFCSLRKSGSNTEYCILHERENHKNDRYMARRISG